MVQWILDTVRGTAPLRNIVVNIMGRDGRVASTRTYFDCVITSHSLGALSADNQDEELIEKITIKPGRYEVK